MTVWTIDGFENLSEQEIFDMSARHLLRTKQKSVHPATGCSYAGTGCAAAPFLKEEFRQAADKCGAWANVVYDGHADILHQNLIGRMQRAHDNARDNLQLPEVWLTEWEGAMRSIASGLGLSTAVFDNK